MAGRMLSNSTLRMANDGSFTHVFTDRKYAAGHYILVLKVGDQKAYLNFEVL